MYTQKSAHTPHLSFIRGSADIPELSSFSSSTSFLCEEMQLIKKKKMLTSYPVICLKKIVLRL